MDDRGKASIVKYDFSDKGNNYEDLLNLLSNMRCDISVLRLTRLGRISLTPQCKVQASAKLRPLKIELQSVADRDRMLLASKSLKNSYQAGIRMSQWLQRNKKEKIKVLRQQCRMLNKNESSIPDGKTGKGQSPA